MNSQSWQCPYCQHFSVVDEKIRRTGENWLIESIDGKTKLNFEQLVCPNPNCHKMAVRVWVQKVARTPGGDVYGPVIEEWNLLPASRAKPQPDYIPLPLRQDYLEACLISDLSPKASATLSRRCLQGMIRNFHKITKQNLNQAINELKDEIDQDVWHAIDAIRKVGNIGAHMEKDINVIVDVDPKEAQLLIELIEQLFLDWYVVRYEREKRVASVKALAEQKDLAKKATPLEGDPASL